MREFKSIDLCDINKDELVDIKDVNININLPVDVRKKQFIDQVGNPYIFKCNGTIVKNTYSKNGKTLDELIEKLIMSC